MHDFSAQSESAKAIVKQAQAGDLAAFKKLYDLESERVYALCLRMAASSQKAKIYTQDTFVRAWQHLDGFREESAFSTWLHRIAVNIVLGDRRSTQRRNRVVTNTDDLTPFESIAASSRPDDAIDLEKQIASLPEKGRMVFVLHDIEG